MALSLILSGVSIVLARRLNIIDQPGSAPHKKHTNPTPIAGGIALLGTIILGGWFTGIANEPLFSNILVAGIPIFLFGLWDDIKNISPGYKLIGQVLAAMILIRAGIRIQIFESPEFFIYGQSAFYILLDQIITIFWILGIVNAFNFVDSMDGLAVGLGSMAAAFFLLFSLESQQPLLSQFSALLMGTCIGLYFFNSPPAKLFLGDSGSQTLGFILATIAISYTPQNAYQSSSWLAPIMILGVPIFDTALVIFSRFRRKLPIYEPGLDHTYHRLVRLKFSPNRAVLVMQMANLLLSCLAFVILNLSPVLANSAFFIIFILSGATLIILDRKFFWV
jgi:UDP-GlcNAc:undecaprenyl-phosphate GlcNAc-1-phosphate transferase